MFAIDPLDKGTSPERLGMSWASARRQAPTIAPHRNGARVSGWDRCPYLQIRSMKLSHKGSHEARLRLQHMLRLVTKKIGTTRLHSRRDRKRVEMLFAHLKRIFRLGLLRLRGPFGAPFEFTLAATAQNLRRLAKLVVRPPPVAKRALRKRCGVRQRWVSDHPMPGNRMAGA